MLIESYTERGASSCRQPAMLLGSDFVADRLRATNGFGRRMSLLKPLGFAAILLAVVVGVWILAEGESVTFPGEQDSDADLTAALDSHRSGDYAEAEASLATLVAEDPEDLDARSALAEALAAQGKNQEALVQLEAVVSQDSHDHEALHEMAVLERLLGDSVAAVRHFEAAVEVAPEAAYLDDLALTYVQLGRYDEAVTVWKRLLEMDDFDEAGRARVYAAMATAYEGAREYDGARRALEQALALTPNDEILRARLEAMAG